MTQYYDLAIDFDDTIRDTNTDLPVEGAMDALNWLEDEGYSWYVLTANQNLAGVQTWMRKYGFLDVIVTHEKMPAKYYVDDRGLKFDGDWDSIIMEIGHN
jgi:phosphoglycolate phosphatase-like HAD superfamily hydrolase